MTEPTITIETPRLTLRALEADDWPALQTIGETPDVARMMGSISVPWTESAVRTWIERSRYTGEIGFRLGIYLRDERLIGVIGIGHLPGTATPSCMYVIAPDHWGHGYASEALGPFVDKCFAKFGLNTIDADIFADNPSSGRVLEKIGFRAVGHNQSTSPARDTCAPSIDYRLTRADRELVRQTSVEAQQG